MNSFFVFVASLKFWFEPEQKTTISYLRRYVSESNPTHNNEKSFRCSWRRKVQHRLLNVMVLMQQV